MAVVGGGGGDEVLKEVTEISSTEYFLDCAPFLMTVHSNGRPTDMFILLLGTLHHLLVTFVSLLVTCVHFGSFWSHLGHWGHFLSECTLSGAPFDCTPPPPWTDLE